MGKRNREFKKKPALPAWEVPAEYSYLLVFWNDYLVLTVPVRKTVFFGIVRILFMMGTNIPLNF